MMKRLLLAAMSAMLLLSAPAAAQKGKKFNTTDDKKAHALLQEGNNILVSFGRGNAAKLNEALDKYKQALDRDPNYIEALYSASEVYADLGQPGNQIGCIMKAVGIDSTFWVTAYYRCAVALCQKERYEESVKWFDLFDKFSKGKKTRVKQDPQWRRKAMAMVSMMKHPVPFEPRYPSELIEQTPYETYWPSISLDETELVVTSRLPIDTVAFREDPTMIARIDNNQTQEDLYVMTRETPESPWRPMQPIYNINTDFNEGTQAISPDGRWMFYTACGYKDSKGSCDIYFSQRTSRGWTRGVNIGAPVNTAAWESQPCFSADGKTLFFVRGSARAAYRSGNIMKAKVTGVNAQGVPLFGSVESLGDSINTQGDESHPFIHHDGKTLFFSSDTWPGVGGRDIFMSRMKDDGTWGAPHNLGYPINNVEDDEGLVVTASGTTGYYNSVRMVDGRRKREVRMFDLYPAIRPRPVPFVRGYISDCGTKKSIPATILLDRMPDGENIATSRALDDGSFTIAVPGPADYLLSVNAKGYFFRSHKFSVADVEGMHGPLRLEADEVCLTPLKMGKKIALRNIYFDTDKWEVKPESKVELEILIRVMRENPTIRVEISGHTDSRASEKHNQTLSENRARSTVNYLVDHGIDRKRFDIKGYGESQPCATNDTEEGMALNRRIEAKIVP